MIAFMVAGTASGIGKTTAALAFMAALGERGLRVQPFKCGPDFLDTGHHSAICRRPARNLDTWMLDRDANRETFVNASRDADAAVVEGMMGLFDGAAGDRETGSSAEIAKLLNLPIILVLDASKSARSIAAIVQGFTCFDPDLRFAGIVLNGVNSENHYRLLEVAICATSSIPLLGRIPKTGAIAIPERHLGLRTAEEETATDDRRAVLAGTVRRYLDSGALLSLKHDSTGWQPRWHTVPESPVRVRYGVARHAASSFYYEDNLDLLRRCGAEIVYFSPLLDSNLPEGLDGLYLGGGYPELYAERLSANHPMLREIRAFAASGSPVYAECGGMLYLGRSVNRVSMTGVLPLEFEMTDRLINFGYVEATFTEDCLLGERGTVVRGHSFHYSRLVEPRPLSTVYRLRYSLSGRTEEEGFSAGSVLASYIHLHFGGNPSVAKNLVARAAAAKRMTEVNQ
jgi:cobyrinic acid a,c-diamide synthase